MSLSDYKRASLYRWLFMFGHYLGYVQYIARFIRQYKNISFKEFYNDFLDFAENSSESIFLKKEVEETLKSLSIFLSTKGPMGRVIDSVRPNFAWDYEEATAINIVQSRDKFYNEVKLFLKKYDLDNKILNDLIEFQKDTIVDPSNNYPLNKTFKFNFYEAINFSAKLIRKDKDYQINGKNYNNDIYEWGKETLWWGRRVAACKAKIKILVKNKFLNEASNQVVELFDKR